MKIYLVGGAVRDAILGIANTKTEKDYVVVGSSADEMLSLGYKSVGKNFPVFLHPQTKEEYALARKEKKVAAGYAGFDFDTSSTITIEQDLYRRDLTINAIAKDKNGNLIDPFGGVKDIKAKIIRHVSDAFIEDPLRVLRVARFATMLYPLGFKICNETLTMMKKLVASGELDSLVGERIFKELSSSLAYPNADVFFDVLRSCNAFAKIFPSFDNNAKKINAFNTDNETVLTKFALWLHTQKPSSIDVICKNINCPKKYHKISHLSASWHLFMQNFNKHSENEILNFIITVDAIRQKDRFTELLKVFQALNIDTKPIVNLLQEINKIDANQLQKNNIANELKEKRLAVIRKFIYST